MNKIVILFLVLLCFSCKKEKFTTESLFLENLKESSNFYEDEIKVISTSIKIRYEEYSVKSTKFDTLNSITKRLDVFLNDIKTKDKQEKIIFQEKFIKDINKLNSEYKLNSFIVEKLKVLDNETLYYYLKSELCKNQFENYNIHYKKLPVYCGYKKLSTKQDELIKIIEASDIK
ncbi:hypothetical protein [Flavobacterium chungnamense]|uniref:Uncharacterized protein n=1 Tax=Flavobacterium chungnamense TaxID=706182 RepID=A0ABP7UEI3_9FLAO